MNITAGDICRLEGLSRIRLIAGESGLENEVTRCGILDYEYDKEMMEKYSQINFQKGQFVFTTFLYAKNNEFLISDAVKRLCSRGASGLLIKNVFRLHIQDSVLRYADSKGFPIFITDDHQIYFEDAIVTITNAVRSAQNLHIQEQNADRLLQDGEDSGEMLRLSRVMNPSFCTDFAAAYLRKPEAFSLREYLELSNALQSCDAMRFTDALFFYRGGVMVVFSREFLQPDQAEELCAAVLETAKSFQHDIFCGVSSLHHDLSGLKSVLSESLCSSILHPILRNDSCTRYSELGSFQILFPRAEDEAMIQFSQSHIAPLVDYDLENRTCLLETAEMFVRQGGSMERTAEALFQHKNTIRYRITKISGLLGRNVLEPEHYENLSIAVKLHLCRKALQDFRELQR